MNLAFRIARRELRGGARGLWVVAGQGRDLGG